MWQIVEDDLNGPEIRALLRLHMREMQATSPPDCVHTLDIAALSEDAVTLWTIWDDAELLGCAALKELSADAGEIKSMRTATEHAGKGVASRLLQHIVDVARSRKYRDLYIETGSGKPFQAAHALYLKGGFSFCGPFANYRDDPFSRFMVMPL
jgi:putative acetyltransferase